MGTTHTHGEWKVKQTFIYDSVGVIATTYVNTKIVFKEAEANAKLIAAAPELLEALIEAEKKLNSILTVCSENPSQMLQDVTYQKIINAIKKATN